MVLPLVILGFERLMEGRGPKLYCLSLFYCLFCNYYIAFMVCLFLVLWFLASEHRGWRKFFTDGLKFAGCSILSAGMAAFSLLTSYFAIMTTASAGTEIPKWEWYGNVFAILKQHIFLTEPITNQTFDGGANLYCGTFTLLLLVLYFISERISTAEKIRKALLLALLVISFNATTLNFIWHGFHDQYGIPNRFAFVYIFTLLTMAYEMAVRLKTMDGAYIIGAVAVCLAFLLGCKYMVKLDLKFSSWLVLGISAGLLLVYAILMILRNRKIMKLPLATGILAGAFSIEILVSAAFGFRADGTASGDYYLSDVDTMQSAVEAVADYAEEQQDSFYREDMVKPVMLDEATLNNMRSVGTFCSTVPGDMVTLMGRLGFYTGANEYLYYGATPLTDAIFGVRFVYQRDGEYYPTNDSQSICYEQDGVTVYENPYALPVAFCVRESLLDWDIQEGKAADCQNGFAALAAGTGDIFENQDIEVTQTEGQAEFTVPQDGDYYMNCRGNYMSKLRIYVNGVETTYGRYQMQMFHLGDLQAGDQVTVEITYSSEHTEGEQMAFYISTFNWENFEAACSQWQENAMEVTEYGDGYLKGTVTVPEGDMLFTSVPYDQGWSIYVDGEKVEAEKVGDALIGVSLSPGTHTIEMKYFPRGLKIGMLITLLSWVAFFVIMNKKNSENAQNV
jgi:uncharacterized membrane protein YfhO